MSQGPPDVSVLVLAYRATDELDACLAGLAAHATRAAVEVVVLLNGATAEVEATVARHREVRTLRSDLNLGYGAGLNRAAAAALGCFLLLLNDDALLEPGCLDALLDAADAHPDAGLLMPLVLEHDGTVQDAGGMLDATGDAKVVGAGLDPDDPAVAAEREVAYATTVATLVRREAFDAVGGFDEAYYPAYWEDVDLGLRLRAAGRPNRVVPGARARHRLSASSDPLVKGVAFERGRSLHHQRWDAAGHRRPGAPAPVRTSGKPLAEALVHAALDAAGFAAAVRAELERRLEESFTANAAERRWMADEALRHDRALAIAVRRADALTAELDAQRRRRSVRLAEVLVSVLRPLRPRRR